MKAITGSPSPNTKLQYIDSLRGIAILMVLITHANKYLPELIRPVQIFSDFGQMGVQLFFILSAFTLCLTFENRNKEQSSLHKFYIRRFCRIAPLFYFGILLYFIYFSLIEPLSLGMHVGVPAKYTFTNIMANVLLLNDFVTGPANNKIVPGGWSIGTETTFYAIFPLIYLFYSKLIKKSKKALMIVPVAGLLFCFAMVQIALPITGLSVKNNSFLYFNIICQLPVFLTGMSLYFYITSKKGVENVKPISYFIGFAVSLFLAVVTYINFQEMAFLIPTSAGICFLFMVMLFKNLPVLNHRFLGRIGQLSYSIYLFHFIFTWEGARFLNAYLGNMLIPEVLFLINILATLGLSTLLAVLSEKYIEKPGIAGGRYIINLMESKSIPFFKKSNTTIIIKQDVNRPLGVN